MDASVGQKIDTWSVCAAESESLPVAPSVQAGVCAAAQQRHNKLDGWRDEWIVVCLKQNKVIH